MNYDSKIKRIVNLITKYMEKNHFPLRAVGELKTPKETQELIFYDKNGDKIFVILKFTNGRKDININYKILELFRNLFGFGIDEEDDIFRLFCKEQFGLEIRTVRMF